MLLLEQDITRKKQVHKNNVIKLNACKDKSEKYKVEAI